MRDFIRTASRYLDDHWILKWFVVPILFMASILFVLGLLTVGTAGETGQLVGLFVGFSFAVVAVGLLIDWLTHRMKGWNVLTSDRGRGE